MSKDLFVTGHPRSGNTWLCRLLSYILYAELDSDINGSTKDYQYWGIDKPTGDYIIHKTHGLTKLGPTVFIYRDPRDVACSRWHYRTKYKTLREAVESLASPEFNENDDKFGEYEQFVRTWYKTGLPDVTIRYEDLHFKAVEALSKVVYVLTHQRVSSQHINNAVFDLEFSTFKARNAPHMDHSMWQGRIGAWKQYFTRTEADMCQYYWGDLMLEQGYIDGPEWVQEVRMK